MKMICKILLRAFAILIAIELCTSKLQFQGSKLNATARSLHFSVKKQNATLNDKGILSKLATPMKKTIVKHHEGNRTIKNDTSNNAVSRQMNMESFIENHKGAIVRLLKKLLLPKLKARALQSHAFERLINTDPSDKSLDKEAMNYELGYFLGLQKAFKNRQVLMGDSGEDDLVPLKLIHKGGSNAAVTESGPMTGFTSVALPFHKITPHPIHETLDSTLRRYGMQDPGFVKKITKADERDILQFAGKHNMDVFAERNNLKGISDYLAKRNFISRPVQAPPTNEAASQRIKKDDILRSYVVAEEPDKPRDDGPTAMVETGPNPLENVPTPLHRMVSQADHISTQELNGLIGESGEDKINMKEIYGLIENEEKAKERLEDQDKTPQIGTIFGEDTNVQAENGFKTLPSRQEIAVEELDKADNGQGESEVEKRTLKGLMSIIEENEYEEERNELRHVLRKIIDKLSEIPNYNQKRNLLQYGLPHYQNRGLMSRAYIPYYYYSPFYRAMPIRKLWRRNIIPRPIQNKVQKREELPHENDAIYGSLKTSDNINDYEFQPENNRPPDLEETGGVEAYALPKMSEKPSNRLENFVSTPKEESLGEAIALLNRGSSIDDSLGDHLQAGFLQRFVLPNAPPTLYKRNVLKMPRKFRVKSRNKRSNDVKKNAKVPKKKKVVSKRKKHHGKKKSHQSDTDNAVKVMSKETNAEVTSVGSKKHEILRDPTIPILSGLDNYVSPAVFESKSQNFFTSGPHDGSHIISQLGAGTVLLSGPDSGIGTVTSNPKYHRQRSNENYKHRSRYLEHFIANPRMSGFRSPSYQRGQSRSGLVGNRHISPALDIYNDNSVSSNGDLPVMEVQTMRPNGAMPDQIGPEQAMQEVPQGSPDVAQVGNIVTQNGAETEGQGSVEMSSKYEVVKSPGVQEGNLQLINGDEIAQQNSQVIDDPKGDEHTGANAMAVEEISGETKQAISNTLAALDKQSVAQARLDGGATLEHPSSSSETPIYDERLAAHPLSDHNMVQTLNQASKGLDEEVLLGSSAHHLTENRVPAHVYLPNEDFDGIDWKKLHQPVHGPLGNDANSKEEIQLLSDPFFAPGVGEPIGDHSKPSIVSPLANYNPANHLTQQANAQGPQIVLSTPSVADIKTAPSALLTADAVNTVKAITNAGVIQAVPGATAAVSANAAAVPPNLAAASANVPAVSSTAPAGVVNTSAVANLEAAQKIIAANQATAPLLSTAEQQLHAHNHAVNELHKEIASNAEISAVQTGTAIANTAQKATNAHYIADIKNAAMAKIKDNNEHAAQLHQLGNTVTAQNTNVAAKATEYLNNAVVAAAHNVHVPVSPSVSNVTSSIPTQPISSYGVMHSLEEPYSTTVQRLENEANKAADLHHDALHMGTYINQEAAHALNSHSVSNVLSHDHIDENMRTPAIIGDWHSIPLLHHDAYPYHWNHVELESQPQVIDMSPMTPGGIHFMTNTNNLGAATGAAAGVDAASANAAGGAAANANAARAAAANANAASAAAANANAASAAAANANAANPIAASANAASANAASANAASANAIANSAAVSAANANAIAASGGTAAVAKPGVIPGAVLASNGAGNDFIGGKTEASNIGSSGGMMKQGTNVVKGAGSAKATVASKDDISGNGMKEGYPDLVTTDSDKRNATSNEESFDNDSSKIGEQKQAKKAQEHKATDENSNDENSGFDASTASTANEEGGGEISFDTTKDDDFQMENNATNEGSKLDGTATMEFNQTNDDDASGAENEQLKKDKTLEEPMIESDEKTTSLQVGNLKESKVQNYTDSATTASEVDDDFVTESDTQDKANVKEGQSDENGMDSGTNENGESRSGSKTNKSHKTVQKGELIQSDEVIRGNRYKPTHKAHLRGKGNQAMSYKHLARPLQKKLKVGKKHAAGKKRVHTPIAKSTWKNQPSRIKGPSGSSIPTVTATKAKMNSSAEFFIGNGVRKHTFRNKMEKSSDVQKQNTIKGHAKHKNSSEFFLIKTNNLTEAEPTNEESLFTKNESKEEFITGAKKTIDDLADFQLSDSAKKHLLPGDLEKLEKLHRMLSMAQINLLKKEEPQEVKGLVRTLKQKGTVGNAEKDTIKGQYRGAINEALKQIEGVRKSLINQEGEEDSGKLPKNEQYRAAIHEALKEVEAVKKSLMEPSSSSTKLLTNALAISNLANLLRESTNIFNKAYGAISENYPNVASNMVTGDLISPGTSGVLINPAVKTSSQQNQQLPDVARKSTKDIYAEIGSPAMVEEENSEKKSLKRHPINTHIDVKHPGFRTIKETKRQQIGKN